MSKTDSFRAQAEHNGHTVKVSLSASGELQLETDALTESRGKGENAWTTRRVFTSWPAIRDAIDRYQLDQRKAFTNRKAFALLSQWGDGDKYQEVEVTSLDESGREAWTITKDGTRRQHMVWHLYESEDACKEHVSKLKELKRKYEADILTMKKALRKVYWIPNDPTLAEKVRAAHDTDRLS